MPKSCLGLISPFPEIPEESLPQVGDNGRKETRAAELFGAPVPGLSGRALWDLRPMPRPPFPRGREQRPRSGADSTELERGCVGVCVCVLERETSCLSQSL